MKKTFTVRPIALAVLALTCHSALAEPITIYITSVVTTPSSDEVLTVDLDPKAPYQPIPASDGASFLKNVPGFSMVRKGGTDGDPVLRGLSGSRLPVLLDGMDFHGGCSSRMDPPTAYVFPESFDNVKIIKGPQTVAYGNGNSAGVVLFERDNSRIPEGVSGDISGTMGSWDRKDVVANVQASIDELYLKTALTHAESGNYEDGDGVEIHSKFERESATLIGGYRMDYNTNLEIDYITSRGEAAYADRTLDGSQFDRESYGLNFEKKNLSSVMKRLDVRLYHTDIDHVMDNYSLRADPAANNFSVMEVARNTDGFRVSSELSLSDAESLKVGADVRGDEHSSWMAMMGQKASQATADAALASATLTKDYESQFVGVFGEWTHRLEVASQMVSGFRADFWDADRWNSMNGAFVSDDSDALYSGFFRYENQLNPAVKTYLGFGHSERPMDYWEATKYNGLNATSSLNPEKTNQLDAGMLWHDSKIKASISSYYAKVDDYILVSSATDPDGRFSNDSTSYSSGNVDVTRYGVEGDVSYAVSPSTSLTTSLAYVRADNDTHDVPLAQTPPLEITAGVNHKIDKWSLGGLLRWVDEQDRIDTGYGTVVGVDLGEPTSSFMTVSLNGSYQASDSSMLSFGIDNLLDKTYSEHVSGDANDLFGDSSGLRVTEPGRTLWLKANIKF
jgi:iron complex outermembrane receptor protein